VGEGAERRSALHRGVAKASLPRPIPRCGTEGWPYTHDDKCLPKKQEITNLFYRVYDR
jgi:hypothetical protein